MEKHKGYSLVELMITIAIMAILVGLIGLSANLLKSADTKEVAHEINSGLTELKSQNMGRNKPIYMHFNMYNGSYYVNYTESETFTPDGTGREVGAPDVMVSVDGTVMNNGDDICILIQKKDGAFALGPEKIVVTGEGASDYTVWLVKRTGRHYVE